MYIIVLVILIICIRNGFVNTNTRYREIYFFVNVLFPIIYAILSHFDYVFILFTQFREINFYFTFYHPPSYSR